MAKKETSLTMTENVAGKLARNESAIATLPAEMQDFDIVDFLESGYAMECIVSLRHPGERIRGIFMGPGPAIRLKQKVNPETGEVSAPVDLKSWKVQGIDANESPISAMAIVVGKYELNQFFETLKARETLVALQVLERASIGDRQVLRFAKMSKSYVAPRNVTIDTTAV